MSKKLEKQEVEKDFRKYKDIHTITNQSGGKQLISLLTKDIITAIDTIAGSYKTLSHTELIAQGARLSERLSMYRLLTSSKKNADIVEDILKTEYKDTDDTD